MAFEVGATVGEVQQAVADAERTIQHADEMMQRKAYELMDVRRADVPVAVEATGRLAALVKLGAAVASNCASTIAAHLALAHSSGATKGEITVAIKFGQMIVGKAGQFAREMLKESHA